MTAFHRCEASTPRTAGAEEEGEKEKEAETAEGSDGEDEDEDEEDSDYAGSDAAFEVGLDQRGLDDPIEQVGIGYELILTMPATAGLSSRLNALVIQVFWMVEHGEWQLLEPAASRQLELARREGTITCSVSSLSKQLSEVHGPYKCQLQPDPNSGSRELMAMTGTGDSSFRLRRHVKGEGLQGEWEMFTTRCS